MDRPSTAHAPICLWAIVTALACALMLLVACRDHREPGGPGGPVLLSATSASPSPRAMATAAASVPVPSTASVPPAGSIPSLAPVPAAPPATATPAPPVTTAPPITRAPPQAKAVTGLVGAGLVLERAPIEALDLRVAESGPPQHFVDVTSGLPNGCARFYGYELVRAGETITVTVWNTMPADIRAACTMQYGFAIHAVPLGANLVPGRQYTLQVNDRHTTFTAR